MALPYADKLLQHPSKLGALTRVVVEEKQHLMPILPQLLDKLDPILGNLELIEPFFDRIAPHADKLLPHMEELVPHLDKLIVHLDAVLLFLECDGWEAVLPFLEPICRNIDALAPHAPALVPYFHDIVEHLPMYADHLDTVAPHLDKIVPHLDKLLGAAEYTPSKVQRMALSSHLVCKSLPTTAKIVPSWVAKKADSVVPRQSMKSSSTVDQPWIPANPAFSVPSFVKRVNADNKIIVYYCVMLKEVSGACYGSKYFRYSELRLLHKRIVHRFPSLKKGPTVNLSFPKKKVFHMGDGLLEKRRLGLETYLQGLARFHASLRHFDVYRCFIQSIYIQGLLAGTSSR